MWAQVEYDGGTGIACTGPHASRQCDERIPATVMGTLFVLLILYGMCACWSDVGVWGH